MGRKIAIVGKGPTASAAPFSDESWEIWGLAWAKLPREDKTFDIHGIDCFESQEQIEEFRRCAESKQLPVIGGTPLVYPNNEPFPYDAVFDVFGVYFESSIAYMLALAILERPEEICMWGVHMQTKTEYVEQLANLEYILGFGRGLGVKISVCPGAPICMSSWMAGRYGINNNHRFKGAL